MSRRYCQKEKEYMIDKAIEVIESLDGNYPSFKNYVWAVQHVLKGGEINNATDKLVYDILKSRGKLK